MSLAPQGREVVPGEAIGYVAHPDDDIVDDPSAHEASADAPILA